MLEKKYNIISGLKASIFGIEIRRKFQVESLRAELD
jgi:hypothetical protein